ncbi:hypothetical protein [Pseudomonas sp. S3_H04]
MAMPNDAPSFPAGISLTYASGSVLPSQSLVTLLTTARESYDWPFNTGRVKSQQKITDLEATVKRLLKGLTTSSAQQIIAEVSSWAGNYKPSHRRILNASASEQLEMLAAIQLCLVPGGSHAALNALSRLPGISLVIASKIYRFVRPKEGAAVDRHASYFFNSLAVTGRGTAFIREWPNKSRRTSRLATYSNSRLLTNLDEYVNAYLPLLSDIANFLNRKNHFHCPVANQKKSWTPADVEMAAYYWWARNGAK